MSELTIINKLLWTFPLLNFLLKSDIKCTESENFHLRPAVKRLSPPRFSQNVLLLSSITCRSSFSEFHPILSKHVEITSLNSFTYLLTPWSRVLLEKLTGSAASQEIPRIFGTRRFLTVFKVPATCPYPEPTPSIPHNPLPLPEDPS